jgi:uncharacterized membrane protein
MNTKEFWKAFFKKIFEFFLQGLLYLTPLGITIWVTYNVLRYIDQSLQPAIERVFNMQIPGLGFVLIFVIITLAGVIGQGFFATQIRLFVQRLIKKAPILESIYSSIKDFVSAFVGKERKFTKAVLVKINADLNIEKIGFITQENLENLKIQGKVAVYFPYSYSFMGDLCIVPADQVKVLDIHPAEAMKFIISGGLTTVSQNEENKQNETKK